MMELYGYYHSSASYRVRIALNLKGIKAETHYVNLVDGAQQAKDYAAINPQMLIPSLIIGKNVLTQSLAILEYLEETHPTPNLLPKDTISRAHVRAIAHGISADVAPINNLKVRKRLHNEFKFSDDDIKSRWVKYWIEDGLSGIEGLLTKTAGKFSFGDSPTIADCCLIPQMFNARRFNCDTSKFPTIERVTTHCETLREFIAAQPGNQPDAPK